MRRVPALLAIVCIAATPVDDAARLKATRAAAAAADARAERLRARAERERTAADRAAAQERGLRRRVAAAAAALVRARAAFAAAEARLAAQRARLARSEAPAAALLAALVTMARRPAVAIVAQPGSIDDLVHLRAALGTALPVIRARTASLRSEIERMRGAQTAARLAAGALRARRVGLEAERTALAVIEARHRAGARALGRGSLSEAERALALGEQARDLVDRMTEAGSARATAADLAALPGPIPRPLAPGTRPSSRVRDVYRLPVEGGHVVTGFGELSPAGVRSRGLTLAVAPGSAVRAPAGGTVRFAGRFRSFGGVVIVDHRDGWTTTLAGLGAVAVRDGEAVAMGQPVGRAAGGDARVTVELRRQGRAMDLLAIAG